MTMLSFQKHVLIYHTSTYSTSLHNMFVIEICQIGIFQVKKTICRSITYILCACVCIEPIHLITTQQPKYTLYNSNIYKDNTVWKIWINFLVNATVTNMSDKEDIFKHIFQHSFPHQLSIFHLLYHLRQMSFSIQVKTEQWKESN